MYNLIQVGVLGHLQVARCIVRKRRAWPTPSGAIPMLVRLALLMTFIDIFTFNHFAGRLVGSHKKTSILHFPLLSFWLFRVFKFIFVVF